MLSQAKVHEKYEGWIENEYFDLETRNELLGIKSQEEIEDRFYTDLKFGTGGMRGVLGAGTNRMNKYVIRKATQGLADVILEHGEEACKRGVVIAFDSRRYSTEFALETALVLAANGIKAYLFENLRPTPELSFAVRYLKAKAGVNITASHNTKEYNGYKAYWEDGGQIPPAMAERIVAKMADRPGWTVKFISRTEAEDKGLLQIIGEEVDRAYYEEIKRGLLYPELSQAEGEKVKIVFTPLHGTAGEPISRILQESGFTALTIVKEQEKPDSEFPTVESPNPEDPAAFLLALREAERQQAVLILATDPDGDRLGLYAKDQTGRFQRFTGNQIGVLLAYYLLSQRKKLGKLPANSYLLKTIASTDLGDEIALRFGVNIKNVLVGFKYIGEQIKDMEEKGWGTFVFGFEESHGYLAGTYTRDKDAVQAAALLAEAALYYMKTEDKTLPEVQEEIFRKHGYYLDEQVAVTLQGREGKERIKSVMDTLRNSSISSIGGRKVSSIEDFQESKRVFLNENREESIKLPQENVIRFSLEGGGFVLARPSGTEPKIRFYFCIRGNSPENLKTAMDKVKKDFFAGINKYLQPSLN